MQDENIRKMSKMALPQLTDVPTINILICDLIHRLKRNVTSSQLDEFLVNSGLVSYFFYKESLAYLVKSEALIEKNGNDDIEYILTNRGISCAKELKNYVSKIYRDKAILTALGYYSKEKFKDQIDIDYIENPDGYYVHVRCLDKSSDLMELKFNIGTLEQAKFLGNKVLQNPSEFYESIWKAFDTSDMTPTISELEE